MSEPHIVINGTRLTDAQAMSVRVAVSSFRGEMLGPNVLGNDAHGITMAKRRTATGWVKSSICWCARRMTSGWREPLLTPERKLAGTSRFAVLSPSVTKVLDNGIVTCHTAFVSESSDSLPE